MDDSRRTSKLAPILNRFSQKLSLPRSQLLIISSLDSAPQRCLQANEYYYCLARGGKNQFDNVSFAARVCPTATYYLSIDYLQATDHRPQSTIYRLQATISQFHRESWQRGTGSLTQDKTLPTLPIIPSPQPIACFFYCFQAFPCGSSSHLP